MRRNLETTLSEAASRSLSPAGTMEWLADMETEARQSHAIERRFKCSRLQAKPSIDNFHFARLIGWRACQANYRVGFTTAMHMLNHLSASQVDHSLVRKVRTYTEPTLLIVDGHSQPTFIASDRTDRSS